MEDIYLDDIKRYMELKNQCRKQNIDPHGYIMYLLMEYLITPCNKDTEEDVEIELLEIKLSELERSYLDLKHNKGRRIIKAMKDGREEALKYIKENDN